MTGGDQRCALTGKGSARGSPSGFERRLYLPHTIAAIVAELSTQNIDPHEALEGTGLKAGELNRHTTKISYRHLDQVMRNATRLSSNTSVALLAGQRMHVTAYGMYGYALLSSSSYAEARDFAAKYIRTVGPCCDFTVAEDDANITITFNPMYWPSPADPVHQFAIEFALSAHLTTTRDWAGPQFCFSRIALDYPAPPHATRYSDLFGCGVLFQQQNCSYLHPKNDGRVRLADPRSHAIAREMCEQLLDEVNRTGGTAADIRQLLIEQPGRYPSIGDMAEKLHMYPRALRRKLEVEGTSYRDILAEVRARLAMEYLRKTRMTIEEIAGRVGYSDAANFRHAFVRWTGSSPSSFRNAARPD